MENKKERAMTTRERFLGALWVALNCSRTNDEILEVMDLLKADRPATRLLAIYAKDKRKGTREHAIEDLKSKAIITR